MENTGDGIQTLTLFFKNKIIPLHVYVYFFILFNTPIGIWDYNNLSFGNYKKQKQTGGS